MVSFTNKSTNDPKTLFYWPDRHRLLLKKTLNQMNNKDWSWELPIFILNRCWLRLEKIKIYSLSTRLPIDNSAEAPEIKRYYQLLKEGRQALFALQECWHEFGMEEFYRALRISWNWQSSGNKGWTYKKYISLINQYKNKITSKTPAIPLIILGREGTKDHYSFKWINAEFLESITP